MIAIIKRIPIVLELLFFSWGECSKNLVNERDELGIVKAHHHAFALNRKICWRSDFQIGEIKFCDQKGRGR